MSEAIREAQEQVARLDFKQYFPAVQAETAETEMRSAYDHALEVFGPMIDEIIDEVIDAEYDGPGPTAEQLKIIVGVVAVGSFVKGAVVGRTLTQEGGSQ